MNHLFRLLLLCLCVVFLSACKSSEMVADEAKAGMDAAEETAAMVVNEATETVAVANEMSAEAILARHIEAKGGKDNIKAIQSITWKAGMEMMGMNMPLMVQLKRPNKMRQDVDIQAMGTKVVSGFDGTTGWTINPMMGGSGPQQLPPQAVKEMEEQANMDGAVIHFMEQGYDMSYEGEEMVNEKPAHKVMVQLPNNKSAVIFFDAESYLEVKTVREGTNPATGALGTIAAYTSDYRDVGGVMMAHKISAEFDGQLLNTLQIEAIEINKDIPDSVFEMPGMGGSTN